MTSQQLDRARAVAWFEADRPAELAMEEHF